MNYEPIASKRLVGVLMARRDKNFVEMRRGKSCAVPGRRGSLEETEMLVERPQHEINLIQRDDKSSIGFMAVEESATSV